MSQQLILPINKCKLTASYKTDAYRNKFGFTHYGSDMVSTTGTIAFYASGDGEVVATGTDSVVGNVVAVKYPQAVNHTTGKVQDIIIRYYHLASISVKKGDKVDIDIKLGNCGNTGSLQGMAVHLHIEVDTDTANPLFSPTVTNSSLLKGTSQGANDTTMTNPLEWMNRKTSAPEKQTFTTTNDAYIRTEDKTVPLLDETDTSDSERLREEIAKLEQDVIGLNAKISALEDKLKQINLLSA